MRSIDRLSRTTLLIASVSITAAVIIGALNGCSEEGPAGPAGPVGDNDLMDPGIQPRVVSTYPPGGSVGPFDLYYPGSSGPNFIVQFNKLINISDIQVGDSLVKVQGFDTPLRIHPSRSFAKRGAVPSSVNDDFGDVVEFAIELISEYSRISYEIGKQYVVTLDGAIRDINGLPLGNDYVFGYTPEPYFRVVYSIPQDQSTNVSHYPNIIVVFNSPVDSKVNASLHFSPQVPGQWGILDWNPYEVRFYPYDYFNYSTRYTYQVGENASDTGGNLIHTPLTVEFETESFGVSGHYPDDRAKGISPIGYASIDFNGYFDSASAYRAFSIEPGANGTLEIGNSSMAYNHTGGLVPETEYTITIGRELRSIEGIPLDSSYSFSFTTDRFRVRGEPYRISDQSGHNSVVVYFNDYVDTSSIPLAFSITPFLPVTFTMGQTGFRFSPVGGFAPSTTYEVTIGAGTRSIHGPSMGVPFSFGFTTGR